MSQRDGLERGVELRSRSKTWSHLAKLNDPGADRQRRQQSRTLRRLGSIGQGKGEQAPSRSAADRGGNRQNASGAILHPAATDSAIL